jgi:hypothetical protein
MADAPSAVFTRRQIACGMKVPSQPPRRQKQRHSSPQVATIALSSIAGDKARCHTQKALIKIQPPPHTTIRVVIN